MSRTLILTRVARREFDEAADWYDEQRDGLGTRFIMEVNNVLDRLRANAEQYAVLHENLREALVHEFPFAVYYRIEDTRIVVVAVIHTARDPGIWMSRA